MMRGLGRGCFVDARKPSSRRRAAVTGTVDINLGTFHEGCTVPVSVQTVSYRE